MIEFFTIMIQAQKAKMDERGASAVEYGLLVAGIALAIVAAVWAFGGSLAGMFSDAGASLENRPTN